VPDQKPPRLAAGELDTVLALLQYQRDSLVRKVAGVDDSSARVSPVRSGTSLLWLIKHMAGAETTWLQSRFAGQQVEVPDDFVQPGDTLDSAIAFYQYTWKQSDAIARRAATLDDVCLQPQTRPQANLRWVLAHLLEETARHAGHADVLRELPDGATVP
jgi:uncharacterized damage-inducible protein DinB